MTGMLFQSFLAAALLSVCAAIPIDNGVEGEAEISCGPTSITINFNTENAWEGNLYVKNQFAQDECVVRGTGNGQLGSIELGFDQCGVVRERSLEPRGVFVSVTVVMSFHPTFITKVDRAVRAQCFYMEADKTVSTEIEVSMLTTALATFNVPMPICRYEIREADDQDSDIVAFATVGQSVFHHWICDSDYQDTFCSYPYGCFVDDGSGDRVELLDDDGCALDGNLLNNPEQPEDLWSRVEAHVFKYADRPNLYFNCQMRVTIKEPGQDCPAPQCGTAPQTRGKRQAKHHEDAFITDVSVKQPVMVADIDMDATTLPRALMHYHNIHNNASPRATSASTDMCMTSAGLGLLVACCVALLVTAIGLVGFVVIRRSTKSEY